MLGDYPSGLSAKGELSIEMAKVLSAMPGNEKIRAQYVLELNPSHPMFARLESLLTSDQGEVRPPVRAALHRGNAHRRHSSRKSGSEFVKLVNEFIA